MKKQISKIFSVALLLIIPFYACKKNIKNVIWTISGKHIAEEKLDEFILATMDSVQMPGLSIAIINDAKVVYHRTFGVKNINTMEEVNERTIFEGASISKPLFAYFVMKIVEKGLLDLDKPLYKYLRNPDIEHDERYKLITARMVLCHTTGFPNWRNSDSNNDIARIGKMNIMFAPGTEFSYSGEGYQYLADVVAHLHGTNIEGLDPIFQNEIAQSIGAKRLYYNWNDDIKMHKATGHRKGKATNNGLGGWNPKEFGAAYSIHTESINYAKFLIAIMKEEGLNKELIDEMLKEHVSLPTDHEFRKLGMAGWSLGFAIDDHTSNGIRYSHGGDNNNNNDFQAYCHFYREKGFGIIYFTNSDKAFNSNFSQKLGAFLEDEIKLFVEQDI